MNKHNQLYFKAFILLFILCIVSKTNAQRTEVLQPHIKTIQLIVNDDYRLAPIIELGSDDYIEISFDHLSHEYNRYIYSITHCDSEWNPSNLSEFDYLDGFNNNPIDDFDISLNTTTAYTHYRFILPNDIVRPTISGNYQITVYNEDDNQKPILKTYFRVYEKSVSLTANVSSDTDIDRNKAHQQVDFVVDYKGYTIRNPQQEIKVHVLQNGRFDNMAKNVLPTYVSPTELRYQHKRDLIFSAGNEYRRFEIVSTKYAGMGVESLQYFAPFYHATLIPSEPRLLNYIYDEDQNGKYVVRFTDAIDNNTEADYFFVHFTLDCDQPFYDGKVYLEGEFTYDRFDDISEMRYNKDQYNYENVQLLKQGSYNYQYLYVKNGSNKGETGPVEGNFYQTENDYLILIYHRPFGERYDKLIGMKQIRFEI